MDIRELRDEIYGSNDYLAGDQYGFDIGSFEDCYWSISGSNQAFTNRLAVFNGDPDIFKKVLQPFYDANIPHYVKLGAAGLAHVDALRAKGYKPAGASPLMARTLNSSTVPYFLREGLSARVIESREELMIAKEINGSAFNRPYEARKPDEVPFPDPEHVKTYLLFEGALPVSTLRVVRRGKFASVTAMATSVEHQRMGYATDLLNWAMAKYASEGAEIALLHSSQPGRKLYLANGFEIVEFFQNWQMNATARMRRFTHEILHLDGFTLRPPHDTDVDTIVERLNDPEISRWTPVPNPYTAELWRAFVDRAVAFRDNGQGIEWVIERDGQIVGSINCHHTEWSIPRVEIGYIIHAPFRGQGIAPKVLGQLARFLVSEYGFKRVEVRADARNVASMRTALKAGFTDEGRIRSNYTNVNTGEVTDDAVFSMVAGDL